MTTHDTLMQRRTVHNYSRGAIPETVLTKALEAALMAPSHRLTFPMRFYRLGAETRETLLQNAGEKLVQKCGAPLTETQLAKLQRNLTTSGELIAFTQVLCDDPFRAKEDYATLACSIQNFCLSLWADGFGSKWSTGGLTRETSTYKLLGIDGSTEEIVGFVSAGIPLKACKTPQRPSLEQTLRTCP